MYNQIKRKIKNYRSRNGDSNRMGKRLPTENMALNGHSSILTKFLLGIVSVLILNLGGGFCNIYFTDECNFKL